MRTNHLAFAVAVSCALLAACAETGQDRVSIPLQVAGTDVSAGMTAVGGVSITLTRADLAFGPLYLCSGYQAGELCDTARLEWLKSVVIDATDEAPADAGTLVGVTGPVRSWMFDLGLSSQLTQSEPVVLDAARELGGVSLILEGEGNVNGMLVPFHAAVPVQQSAETELGVPVIRKSTSEVFSHDVSLDDTGLVIRFDPAPWVEGVDFRTFVEDGACAVGGPETVCAGSLEQSCDSDGSVSSSRDCTAMAQVCLAGQGCADALEMKSESSAFRSVRNAVVVGERPAFEWH